jgi:hypothetical protein
MASRFLHTISFMMNIMVKETCLTFEEKHCALYLDEQISNLDLKY